MLAAKGDIPIVATDLHLGAFSFHRTIGGHPYHHGRFMPTKTDRFEFGNGVGPRQKGRASGEQFAPKIGPEAITHHRNICFIDHFGQLVYLFFGQKLGLIKEDAIARFGRTGRPKIGLLVKVSGFGADADS